MGNCLGGGKKESRVEPNQETEKKFDPVSPSKPPAPEPSVAKQQSKDQPSRAESGMVADALKAAAAIALKQQEQNKGGPMEDEKGIKFKDRKSLHAHMHNNPDENKPLILTYDYEEMTRALVGAYEMGNLEKALVRLMAERKKDLPIDVIIKTRAVLEGCYYRVLEKKVRDSPG